jgi:hypothetical protein
MMAGFRPTLTGHWIADKNISAAVASWVLGQLLPTLNLVNASAPIAI